MTDPKLSRRARDYLARVALSQGAYLALMEDALSLLPAADASRAGSLEPLETFLTIKGLAAKLGAAYSTVRGDLRRLELFGWTRPGSPRLLGHRDGHELFLLSDVAAWNVTGLQRLVSREVLQKTGPAPVPVKAEDAEPSPGAWRGARRKWVQL